MTEDIRVFLKFWCATLKLEDSFGIFVLLGGGGATRRKKKDLFSSLASIRNNLVKKLTFSFTRYL